MSIAVPASTSRHAGPTATTPMLVLHGARDPFPTADSVTFFAARATPERAFVVLPDSDHAAHVKNSHRVWMHAIREFLRQPRT